MSTFNYDVKKMEGWKRWVFTGFVVLLIALFAMPLGLNSDSQPESVKGRLKGEAIIEAQFNDRKWLLKFLSGLYDDFGDIRILLSSGIPTSIDEQERSIWVHYFMLDSANELGLYPSDADLGEYIRDKVWKDVISATYNRYYQEMGSDENVAPDKTFDRMIYEWVIKQLLYSNVRSFETVVAEIMTVNRYMKLFKAACPSLSDVYDMYREQNPEILVDYAFIPLSSFEQKAYQELAVERLLASSRRQLASQTLLFEEAGGTEASSMPWYSSSDDMKTRTYDIDRDLARFIDENQTENETTKDYFSRYTRPEKFRFDYYYVTFDKAEQAVRENLNAYNDGVVDWYMEHQGLFGKDEYELPQVLGSAPVAGPPWFTAGGDRIQTEDGAVVEVPDHSVHASIYNKETAEGRSEYKWNDQTGKWETSDTGLSNAGNVDLPQNLREEIGRFVAMERAREQALTWAQGGRGVIRSYLANEVSSRTERRNALDDMKNNGSKVMGLEQSFFRDRFLGALPGDRLGVQRVYETRMLQLLEKLRNLKAEWRATSEENRGTFWEGNRKLLLDREAQLFETQVLDLLSENERGLPYIQTQIGVWEGVASAAKSSIKTICSYVAPSRPGSIPPEETWTAPEPNYRELVSNAKRSDSPLSEVNAMKADAKLKVLEYAEFAVEYLGNWEDSVSAFKQKLQEAWQIFKPTITDIDGTSPDLEALIADGEDEGKFFESRATLNALFEELGRNPWQEAEYKARIEIFRTEVDEYTREHAKVAEEIRTKYVDQREYLDPATSEFSILTTSHTAQPNPGFNLSKVQMTSLQTMKQILETELFKGAAEYKEEGTPRTLDALIRNVEVDRMSPLVELPGKGFMFFILREKKNMEELTLGQLGSEAERDYILKERERGLKFVVEEARDLREEIVVALGEAPARVADSASDSQTAQYRAQIEERRTEWRRMVLEKFPGAFIETTSYFKQKDHPLDIDALTVNSAFAAAAEAVRNPGEMSYLVELEQQKAWERGAGVFLMFVVDRRYPAEAEMNFTDFLTVLDIYEKNMDTKSALRTDFFHRLRQLQQESGRDAFLWAPAEEETQQ
ncbi:MAG: hypothetical protein NUW37_08960 [Planctomycetes bacterium]|nr:hypothetical protein [Planctomycetota bacterium]